MMEGMTKFLMVFIGSSLSHGAPRLLDQFIYGPTARSKIIFVVDFPGSAENASASADTGTDLNGRPTRRDSIVRKEGSKVSRWINITGCPLRRFSTFACAGLGIPTSIVSSAVCKTAPHFVRRVS